MECALAERTWYFVLMLIRGFPEQLVEEKRTIVWLNTLSGCIVNDEKWKVLFTPLW